MEKEFGFGEEPAVLTGTDLHGRRSELRLRGRIDRVDRTGTGDPVHHVLDYKSSQTPSSKAFEDATILQGALYMQALAEKGLPVGSCRYRAVRKPGRPQNGGRIRFGSTDFEQAMSLALAIPRRVRAGWFEAVVSRKGDWVPWDPGVEIRRSSAKLEEGHRFDRDPDAEGATPRDGGGAADA